MTHFGQREEEIPIEFNIVPFGVYKLRIIASENCPKDDMHFSHSQASNVSKYTQMRTSEAMETYCFPMQPRVPREKETKCLSRYFEASGLSQRSGLKMYGSVNIAGS